MSENYFSDPLTRCVSARRRKMERLLGWVVFPLLWIVVAALIIGLLTLLIFGLEAAWEWLRVTSAELAMEGAESPRLQGAALGLLAFCSLAAVWWAALRIKRGDEEASAARWGVAEMPDTLKREQPTEVLP